MSFTWNALHPHSYPFWFCNLSLRPQCFSYVFNKINNKLNSLGVYYYPENVYGELFLLCSGQEQLKTFVVCISFSLTASRGNKAESRVIYSQLCSHQPFTKPPPESFNINRKKSDVTFKEKLKQILQKLIAKKSFGTKL